MKRFILLFLLIGLCLLPACMKAGKNESFVARYSLKPEEEKLLSLFNVDLSSVGLYEVNNPPGKYCRMQLYRLEGDQWKRSSAFSFELNSPFRFLVDTRPFFDQDPEKLLSIHLSDDEEGSTLSLHNDFLLDAPLNRGHSYTFVDLTDKEELKLDQELILYVLASTNQEGIRILHQDALDNPGFFSEQKLEEAYLLTILFSDQEDLEQSLPQKDN